MIIGVDFLLGNNYVFSNDNHKPMRIQLYAYTCTLSLFFLNHQRLSTKRKRRQINVAFCSYILIMGIIGARGSYKNRKELSL